MIVHVLPLNIGYLWYNLIGCAACVAFSVALQALLGPARRAERSGRAGMSAAAGHLLRPAAVRLLPAAVPRAPRSGPRGGCRRRSAGEIVYFCHDSDHDPRETRTILRHRATGEPRAPELRLRQQAPAQVLAALRSSGSPPTGTPGRWPSSRTTWTRPSSTCSARPRRRRVADFCLDMYRGMGLLDGMRRRALERSGGPAPRVRRGRLLRGRAVRGRDRARPRARRRL